MPHQCTGCGHAFEDGSKEMLSGCPDCGGHKFQFRPASDDGSAAAAADAEPTPELDSKSGSMPDPEPATKASSVAETVGRATTRVRDFVSAEPDPDPEADWPDDLGESNDPDDPNDALSVDDPSPGANDESSGADDASSIVDSGELRGDGIDADSDGEDDTADGIHEEDVAQASARSDVVSSSELSSATRDIDSDDDPRSQVPDEHDESLSAIPDGEPTTDGRVVSEPSGEEPDIAELREQLNDQFESIKILEPGQYELNLMELYDREEYIIALQENGRYVIQVPDQWIGDEPGER